MMHCGATLPFPIYTLVFPDISSGYTTEYCILSHSSYGSCSPYCLNVEIYIFAEDFYFDCKDLLHFSIYRFMRAFVIECQPLLNSLK
jgi:hypothetical protein